MKTIMNGGTMSTLDDEKAVTEGEQQPKSQARQAPTLQTYAFLIISQKTLNQPEVTH